MQSWSVRAAHSLSSPVFQAQGKAQVGDRPVRPGPALRGSAAGPSGGPCWKAAPRREMGTRWSQGLVAACPGSLHGHPWQAPPSPWWAQSQLHPTYHDPIPHSTGAGKGRTRVGGSLTLLSARPQSTQPSVCPAELPPSSGTTPDTHVHGLPPLSFNPPRATSPQLVLMMIDIPTSLAPAWLPAPSGHQGLGPREGRCRKASYGATACGPAAQGSESERLTASYKEERSVPSGLDYLVCKMRV